MRFNYFSILFFSIVLFSCNSGDDVVLFEKLDAEKTHIDFSNNITETKDFNILDYLYFYNGGGVSSGDINNDGLQDIFFAGNQVTDRLFLNKGSFKFEDVTIKSKISKTPGWSWGVTMADVNADGYRYNLLPYEQQHTGHIPTGTFPSKNDILTNPALIEVYDKYYKFTVKSNGSGDYMIMGVPIGTYTVVMDMDLSDIGPFSLSPQDLIRMGRATADQFDGVNFKSSTNLFELPQIVTLNQSVNVQPFWGQPEICQIDITRTDFDLRQSGINISPTAMFMGSLITNSKDYALPKNCKPPQDLGSLCSLETAPGEIIGVRQTIFQDTQGRPILEQAQFPQGAKTIDSDGTWLLEVPMNLDYVTTNEFGEQVLSPDPKIGIPTRGKYRFKIKYTPAHFNPLLI